jgi:hypothetical protein
VANYRPAPQVHPLVLAGLLALAVCAVGAPPARALEPGEFDSAPLDSLLKAHVTANGVDYAGWKASGTAPLDAILARAAAYDPTSVMGKEPKEAFWLNVYNAFAAKQVLEHYPVKSLADIPGFFDRNTVRAGGKDFTLAKIETTLAQLLPTRPEFALGLAPGAAGGPHLQDEAYTAGNVDSLLSASIHDLIARGKIVMDHDANALHLPPGIDHYWQNYAALPKGFLQAFSNYLPLADLVAINSRHPERVVDPVDLSLWDAGAPPPRPPIKKP